MLMYDVTNDPIPMSISRCYNIGTLPLTQVDEVQCELIDLALELGSFYCTNAMTSEAPCEVSIDKLYQLARVF